DLVDEKHIGIEMYRDRKAEAHIHAARVRLDGGVEETPEVRELLDRRHRAVDLAAFQREQRAVEIRVLAPAEIGMEARADLEQRRDPAVHLKRARGRLRGPREELEQRGLPRAVRADDAERSARVDREADVMERLHGFGGRVLAEECLLERAAALATELVRLRKMLGADGKRQRGSPARGSHRDGSGAGRRCCAWNRRTKMTSPSARSSSWTYHATYGVEGRITRRSTVAPCRSESAPAAGYRSRSSVTRIRSVRNRSIQEVSRLRANHAS